MSCVSLVLQKLVCPRFSASLVCRGSPGLCTQPEPQLVSLGSWLGWGARFSKCLNSCLSVPGSLPIRELVYAFSVTRVASRSLYASASLVCRSPAQPLGKKLKDLASRVSSCQVSVLESSCVVCRRVCRVCRVSRCLKVPLLCVLRVSVLKSSCVVCLVLESSVQSSGILFV